MSFLFFHFLSFFPSFHSFLSFFLSFFSFLSFLSFSFLRRSPFDAGGFHATDDRDDRRKRRSKVCIASLSRPAISRSARQPAGRPRTTVQLAGRPAGQDPRSSRPAGRPRSTVQPAGRPAGQDPQPSRPAGRLINDRRLLLPPRLLLLLLHGRPAGRYSQPGGRPLQVPAGRPADQGASRPAGRGRNRYYYYYYYLAGRPAGREIAGRVARAVQKKHDPNDPDSSTGFTIGKLEFVEGNQMVLSCSFEWVFWMFSLFHNVSFLENSSFPSFSLHYVSFLLFASCSSCVVARLGQTAPKQELHLCAIPSRCIDPRPHFPLLLHRLLHPVAPDPSRSAWLCWLGGRCFSAPKCARVTFLRIGSSAIRSNFPLGVQGSSTL